MENVSDERYKRQYIDSWLDALDAFVVWGMKIVWSPKSKKDKHKHKKEREQLVQKVACSSKVALESLDCLNASLKEYRDVMLSPPNKKHVKFEDKPRDQSEAVCPEESESKAVAKKARASTCLH